MDAITPTRDNQTLHYQLTLPTSMRPAAAHQAADTYLRDIGFEPVGMTQPNANGATADRWEYTRGTTGASWYHPNPKRQHTTLELHPRSKSSGETLLEIEMRVSVRGNFPTQKDHDFWQAELRGLQQTFHFAYADASISDYAADRAMWYNIALYGWGLLVFFVVIASVLIVNGWWMTYA